MLVVHVCVVLVPPRIYLRLYCSDTVAHSFLILPFLVIRLRWQSLSVLKTTQSGWANFVQDKFTTLPETSERILATTISAEWTYKTQAADALRRISFSDVHKKVRQALVEEFYGPPGKGHFSPGVQHSLYVMAEVAIESVPEVDTVTLSLPNLHFLPCSIPVYAKNGIKFEDDVYVPTDEPHGIISGTIGTSRKARL